MHTSAEDRDLDPGTVDPDCDPNCHQNLIVHSIPVRNSSNNPFKKFPDTDRDLDREQ